jgi:hypothetical protein
LKSPAGYEVETPMVGKWVDKDTLERSAIHLSPDLATRSCKKVQLYANCEGLRGGRDALVQESEHFKIANGSGVEGLVKLRPLEAGQVSGQWITRCPSPTILYKYSDAVVYVTRHFG